MQDDVTVRDLRCVIVVGFHTFRHTYSTLLKANWEDVKVVQELMRHANVTRTMNIYTRALTPAK